MTAPHGELTVPGELARQISDLLIITEAMLKALRARGQGGDACAPASLEDLAALLTGGQDAAQLIARIEAAYTGLADLYRAQWMEAAP